jgi:hypothetical protein
METTTIRHAILAVYRYLPGKTRHWMNTGETASEDATIAANAFQAFCLAHPGVKAKLVQVLDDGSTGETLAVSDGDEAIQLKSVWS